MIFRVKAEGAIDFWDFCLDKFFSFSTSFMEVQMFCDMIRLSVM